MRGVVEGVGRGLVDRQGAGVGGSVRALAGVNLLRFERPMRGWIGRGIGRGSAVSHVRCFLSRGVNRVSGRGWLAPTHDETRLSWSNAHHVSLSAQGPVMADPRLPDSRWLLNLVITRGTPPRLEGCRPASRGLTLALMTDLQLIAWRRFGANGTGQWDR